MLINKAEKPADKKFAILGMGRFGRSVARTLFGRDCNVTACDHDHARLDEAGGYSSRTRQVDACSEKDLKSIGISNFDAVIIAIGDFETSVTAVMICKEMGAKHVLAKADTMRQKKILKAAGADAVILPEREMGEKTALGLISGNAPADASANVSATVTATTAPSIIESINISDDFEITEIFPPEKWIGKTLESARVRADNDINVIAIKRGNSTIIAPRASEAILQNDVLVVLGQLGATRSLCK